MIHFVTLFYDETEYCCANYSVISMSELVGIYGSMYITTGTKKPNALYADGSPLGAYRTGQSKRWL